MTKSAIKKAFEKLDTSDQAEVLGELASTFASSLADMDRQDALVFDARRDEESRASPLSDVKRRLSSGKKRRA